MVYIQLYNKRLLTGGAATLRCMARMAIWVKLMQYTHMFTYLNKHEKKRRLKRLCCYIFNIWNFFQWEMKLEFCVYSLMKAACQMELEKISIQQIWIFFWKCMFIFRKPFRPSLVENIQTCFFTLMDSSIIIIDSLAPRYNSTHLCSQCKMYKTYKLT